MFLSTCVSELVHLANSFNRQMMLYKSFIGPSLISSSNASGVYGSLLEEAKVETFLFIVAANPLHKSISRRPAPINVATE